jgi:hypothetical protein
MAEASLLLPSAPGVKTHEQTYVHIGETVHASMRENRAASLRGLVESLRRLLKRDMGECVQLGEEVQACLKSYGPATFEELFAHPCQAAAVAPAACRQVTSQESFASANAEILRAKVGETELHRHEQWRAASGDNSWTSQLRRSWGKNLDAEDVARVPASVAAVRWGRQARSLLRRTTLAMWDAIEANGIISPQTTSPDRPRPRAAPLKDMLTYIFRHAGERLACMARSPAVHPSASSFAYVSPLLQPGFSIVQQGGVLPSQLGAAVFVSNELVPAFNKLLQHAFASGRALAMAAERARAPAPGPEGQEWTAPADSSSSVERAAPWGTTLWPSLNAQLGIHDVVTLANEAVFVSAAEVRRGSLCLPGLFYSLPETCVSMAKRMEYLERGAEIVRHVELRKWDEAVAAAEWESGRLSTPTRPDEGDCRRHLLASVRAAAELDKSDLGKAVQKMRSIVPLILCSTFDASSRLEIAPGVTGEPRAVNVRAVFKYVKKYMRQIAPSFVDMAAYSDGGKGIELFRMRPSYHERPAGSFFPPETVLHEMFAERNEDYSEALRQQLKNSATGATMLAAARMAKHMPFWAGARLVLLFHTTMQVLGISRITLHWNECVMYHLVQIKKQIQVVRVEGDKSQLLFVVAWKAPTSPKARASLNVYWAPEQTVEAHIEFLSALAFPCACEQGSQAALGLLGKPIPCCCQTGLAYLFRRSAAVSGACPLSCKKLHPQRGDALALAVLEEVRCRQVKGNFINPNCVTLFDLLLHPAMFASRACVESTKDDTVRRFCNVYARNFLAAQSSPRAPARGTIAKSVINSMQLAQAHDVQLSPWLLNHGFDLGDDVRSIQKLVAPESMLIEEQEEAKGKRSEESQDSLQDRAMSAPIGREKASAPKRSAHLHETLYVSRQIGFCESLWPLVCLVSGPVFSLPWINEQ